MENQEKNPVPSSDTEPASATVFLDANGAARRRFTRLGAGAAGVILTLHSQPGMAAKGMGDKNAMCVAPSGFMSIATGSHGPHVSCFYNRSHGYWKNHPEEWKTQAGIDYNAKFGSIFPATGRYADLADVTLMDVVNPSKAVKDIDQNNVAMQTVAALLNARASKYAGVPTILPEDTVMAIWREYAANGYYTPSSGASIWTGAQVAEYFESTFR